MFWPGRSGDGSSKHVPKLLTIVVANLFCLSICGCSTSHGIGEMEDTMGRQQKYPVQLSDEEREQLRSITRSGKHSARVMQRAQILLWSDSGKQDKEIIALLGCAPMTVSSTRERWVKEKRLEDRPRLGSKPMLDAKQESLLIALACSDAPDGRGSWTMQLLANKMVELKVVESISDETVRRTLKKTNSSRGRKSTGASRK